MNNIFELPESEFDPYLDKLVMTTAIGCLSTSLSMYNDAIRNGLSPEEAYSLALSPMESYRELANQ